MKDRDHGQEPNVSNSDLFTIASRVARSGVLVEKDKTSSLQFMGTYNEGGETHTVALSYSRIVGEEIVRVFSEDTIDFFVQHVDQPNTPALDEYQLTAQADKFPQEILEILSSLKPDHAAMNVFKQSRPAGSRVSQR